jgi:lysophospholipase L1-like esterase
VQLITWQVTCQVFVFPAGAEALPGTFVETTFAGSIIICRNRCIAVEMLRNRLIRSVAKRYRRPDGQHFRNEGYRALAARLLPRVLAKPRR